MREHNSPKHLSGFLIVAFAGAMAVVCGGCRRDSTEIHSPVEEKVEVPEAHNYVNEKMAETAIVVPPNLRENGMATQTYIYMVRSAAAVGLCTDKRNFEAGSADEQSQAAQRAKEGMLGQEINEYISGLPTDNVDPVAVKAITMLSDNFDKMDAYNNAIQNVRISAGTKWVAVFFRLMNDTSSTDDIDFNEMADKVTDNVGLHDAVTIKNVAGGYSKMQSLAHQTYDSLATTQRELAAKYHSDFPTIPLNTNYASRCDLPWYF